MQREYVML